MTVIKKANDARTSTEQGNEKNGGAQVGADKKQEVKEKKDEARAQPGAKPRLAQDLIKSLMNKESANQK